MNAMSRRFRRGERGAILIHVAIALVAIMAMGALVIDYGIMWTARRQAQNSADAAALAAATSLAFDAPNDYNRARDNAKAIGQLNRVFGATLNITAGSGNSDVITQDVSFPTCPPGAPGPPDTCVRVNVYRNDQAQGGFAQKDPLPSFLGRLFGRTSQGVRATATAQILAADQSDCLKPWAVADKWAEVVECSNYHNNGSCSGTWQPSTVWTPDKTFDKYDGAGLNPEVNPPATLGPDYYRAPGTNGPTDPGTGFQPFLPDGTRGPDYGMILELKQGSGSAGERHSSGWFQKLDLPCGTDPDCPNNSGASKYEWQIQNCIQVPLGVGSTLTIDNQTGNSTGPTKKGTYESNGQGDPGLWERDPNARWDATNKTIVNSCAPGICADGLYYGQSPRIVAVPLFDLDTYLAANPNGSGQTVQVTNVLGLFILHPNEAAALGFDLGPGNAFDSVFGALVSVPGKYSGNAVTSASFLRTVILVR